MKKVRWTKTLWRMSLYLPRFHHHADPACIDQNIPFPPYCDKEANLTEGIRQTQASMLDRSLGGLGLKPINV